MTSPSKTPRTASALTALWRMQQERDQLKARVAELEQERAHDKATIEILSDGVRELREAKDDLEVDAAMHAGRGQIIDIDELMERVAELEVAAAVRPRLHHPASEIQVDRG